MSVLELKLTLEFLDKVVGVHLFDCFGIAS